MNADWTFMRTFCFPIQINEDLFLYFYYYSSWYCINQSYKDMIQIQVSRRGKEGEVVNQIKWYFSYNVTNHTIAIQHNEYVHVHFASIVEATLLLPISQIDDYTIMSLTVNQWQLFCCQYCQLVTTICPTLLTSVLQIKWRQRKQSRKTDNKVIPMWRFASLAPQK